MRLSVTQALKRSVAPPAEPAAGAGVTVSGLGEDPAALLDLALGEESAELDLTAERILDAALEQFVLVGIRRSSVEDVARRAGVTRVTVYRRFPRKDALVEAWSFGVPAHDRRRRCTDQPDHRRRGARGRGLRCDARRRSHAPAGHPPTGGRAESVLRQLTVEGGRVIALGTAYCAEQIRRGQRDGELPDYDPEPVAEILARLHTPCCSLRRAWSRSPTRTPAPLRSRVSGADPVARRSRQR